MYRPILYHDTFVEHELLKLFNVGHKAVIHYSIHLFYIYMMYIFDANLNVMSNANVPGI